MIKTLHYEKNDILFQSSPTGGAGLMLLILSCHDLAAQSLFTGTPTTLSSSDNQKVLQTVSQYTAFHLDVDSLCRFLVSQPGDSINLHLHIGSQYNWGLSVTSFDLVTPDFMFTTTTSTGVVIDEGISIETFRGNLLTDSTSSVRLLVSNNTIAGYIMTATETYKIYPLKFLVPETADADVFIIHIDTDEIVPPPVSPWCPVNGFDEEIGGEVVERSEDELYLDLAFDCNLETYINYGGVSGVIDKAIIEGIYNLIAFYLMPLDAAYSDQLNIRVLLGYINVWTVPSPFEGSLSGEVTWNLFKDHWNVNNACINRDVAILLKGSTGGAGWAGFVDDPEGLGAICVGQKTTYALVVDLGMGTSQTIGHELGHVLNARHTPASACLATCYLMCQLPNCAFGVPTQLWDFGQNSLNKINNHLVTTDPLFPNYTHDWCLKDEPAVSGPDLVCNGEEATHHYSSFLAGDLFPTQVMELNWTTGPSLTVVSEDPTAQTVTIMGAGDAITSWVSVNLQPTPEGSANGLGCTGVIPVYKKEVHVGLPISTGTPVVNSYWINGTQYYDVGFGETNYATDYEYSFNVYNVPTPYSESGVATDITPLITGIPHGGCFTATVYAGNECGVNYQTSNFPVTMCFNSQLKKPDAAEIQTVAVKGKAKLMPDQWGVKTNLYSLPEGVFPNPASEKIVLLIPTDQSEVYIHDITGRQVFFGEFSKGTHKIVPSAWQEGMYIVGIRNSSGTNSYKLVVQQ